MFLKENAAYHVRIEHAQCVDEVWFEKQYHL